MHRNVTSKLTSTWSFGTPAVVCPVNMRSNGQNPRFTRRFGKPEVTV